MDLPETFISYHVPNFCMKYQEPGTCKYKNCISYMSGPQIEANVFTHYKYISVAVLEVKTFKLKIY
jgi:hypothetical protein